MLTFVNFYSNHILIIFAMEKDNKLVEKIILDNILQPIPAPILVQIIDEEKEYFKNWIKEREQMFLN